MTRLLILLCCIMFTGCAVVKDARNELRKELVGFKDNWDRYVLKKDDNERLH